MKQIFVLVLSVLILSACVEKQEDGFEVRFKFENVEDGIVRITERIPDLKVWYTDSIEIKNGEGVYKGKTNFPKYIAFCFNKNGGFYGSIPLMLGNDKILISGDYNNIKGVTISGAKTNEEYVKYVSSPLFVKSKKLQAISYDIRNETKNKKDSVAALIETTKNQLFDYLLSVPDFSKNEVMAFIIHDNFMYDISKIEKAVKIQDTSIYDNPYVADYKVNMERELRVMPGKMAPDFRLKDLDGNDYKLSEMKGKYVLIDFSASWCGWCKKEIPYLTTVFNNTQKYREEFVMYTISLDKERALWEKDVKESNLPWKTLSDLKNFEEGIAKDYNIHGIPEIILIDKEGKIMRKGLRGDDMINFINSLFK